MYHSLRLLSCKQTNRQTDIQTPTQQTVIIQKNLKLKGHKKWRCEFPFKRLNEKKNNEINSKNNNNNNYNKNKWKNQQLLLKQEKTKRINKNNKKGSEVCASRIWIKFFSFSLSHFNNEIMAIVFQIVTVINYSLDIVPLHTHICMYVWACK